MTLGRHWRSSNILDDRPDALGVQPLTSPAPRGGSCQEMLARI